MELTRRESGEDDRAAVTTLSRGISREILRRARRANIITIFSQRKYTEGLTSSILAEHRNRRNSPQFGSPAASLGPTPPDSFRSPKGLGNSWYAKARLSHSANEVIPSFSRSPDFPPPFLFVRALLPRLFIIKPSRIREIVARRRRVSR